MSDQLTELDICVAEDNFECIDDEALASITGGCNPDPDAKFCRPDL